MALYLDDCYLRSFTARVLIAEGNRITLDRTAFYPASGGQPGDRGTLRRGNDAFRVTDTVKEGGACIHIVEHEGLTPGDEVHGEIDWTRRYRLMRMHTAAHLLSAIFHQQAGALITGNQLGEDKSRVDFSLEAFDREKLAHYFSIANDVTKRGGAVTISTMPREDASKIPALVKLAMALPESIREVRVIDIGIDRQACGGTHVKDLSEIGRIELVSAENKGKANRRVYYTLP